MGGVNVERPEAEPLAAEPRTNDVDADERRRTIAWSRKAVGEVSGCLRAGCRSGGATGEGGSVPAEGEHGQSDECFRGAESEGDAGQESDLGVGGFDQSLG